MFLQSAGLFRIVFFRVGGFSPVFLARRLLVRLDEPTSTTCHPLSNRGKPGSAKANRCPFDARVKVISGLVLVVSMQLSAKKGSGSAKGHAARQSDRGGAAP